MVAEEKRYYSERLTRGRFKINSIYKSNANISFFRKCSKTKDEELQKFKKKMFKLNKETDLILKNLKDLGGRKNDI